jgi:two-component system, cell cycle response regulator
VSILLIDIDHFKRVNDNYGHLVGDDVLMDVGALLQSAVRSVDVVARYGGEEFVIALPETGLPGATVFAERVREIIEEYRFSHAGGSELHLTASVGVASYPSPGLDTVEDLLAKADQALYRAKAEGRNRVRS